MGGGRGELLRRVRRRGGNRARKFRRWAGGRPGGFEVRILRKREKAASGNPDLNFKLSPIFFNGTSKCAQCKCVERSTSWCEQKPNDNLKILPSLHANQLQTQTLMV